MIGLIGIKLLFFQIFTTALAINARLPNDTRPIRYELNYWTWVHEARFDYRGGVQIHLKVVVPKTKTITLHSVGQGLTLTELRTLDGQLIPTLPRRFDEENQFLIIETVNRSLLELEEFILTIEFYSILSFSFSGFYRSSYVNENGQTKWMATTNFHPTYARRAFPCYDEPGIQAVVGLTLRHGTYYNVAANMPIRRVILGTNNISITYFEDTPPMSPYLVAFIVTDLSFKSEDNQRVFGRLTAVAEGTTNFALEAGVKISKALQALFNLKPALTKVDHVALPTFHVNSVENYGLPKYRETSLFYNAETSPLSQKFNVARNVSHNLAHQFYGNIVTQKWWEFLWMSEGLSSFYEYFGVDEVYPDMRAMEQMQVHVCQLAMDRDSYETSRPMTYDVEDRVDIELLFYDRISHDKSSCVLKMVQHILTKDVFSEGLGAFLSRLKHKAVTPEDLYASLQEVATSKGTLQPNLALKYIMDSWVSQKGYPMITVSRTPTGLITLTQDWFLLEATRHTQPQYWWVPYNLATNSSPDFQQTQPDGWIPPDTRTVTIRPTGHVSWTLKDWVVVNKQGGGYFRVNYDTDLWALIIQELVSGDLRRIHILNRSQFIDDAYNFARVMLIEFQTVFGLLEYLKYELDYIPWATASRVLTVVDRKIASLANYQQFRTFVLNTVTPLFTKLGVHNVDDEPLLDRLARNVAVQWACYVGSVDCQMATIRRIEEYIQTEKEFEPDNLATLFCAGLRGASLEIGIELWKLMQATRVIATRNMLIDALACANNKELLDELLDTIIRAGTSFTNAERNRLLSGIANNGAVGMQAVLQFLEANMEAARSRVFLVPAINNMASWIANQEDLDRLTELVERIIATGTMTNAQLREAQAIVAGNIQWVTNFEESIFNFLGSYLV